MGENVLFYTIIFPLFYVINKGCMSGKKRSILLLGSQGFLGKRILELYFKDTDKNVDVVKGGEWLSFFAKIIINSNISLPGFGLKLKDKRGNGVFTVNNYLYKRALPELKANQEIIVKTDFRFPLLVEGKYSLTIAISDGNQENHTQHH